MKKILSLGFLLAVCATWIFISAQKSQIALRQVSLPTGKILAGPTPGRVGRLNGFSAAMVVSPDERYAVVLNDGFGSQESKGFQTIGVWDLSSNTIANFTDDRMGEEGKQSYFLGLAFSHDGGRLYASVGSITDPNGEKPGDTGNGIAVYRFVDGKITPEKFLKVPPQNVPAGKKVLYGLRKPQPDQAIPYPAGLTVIVGKDGKEKLLVANNYSDTAVLMDGDTGTVDRTFDLSTHSTIPASFPYGVVATRDGRRAWCSLWNASRVAELDLQRGTVTRWIPLLEAKDPLKPGSHPTAMLLSHDEKELYVALADADHVAVVPTTGSGAVQFLDTAIPGQKFPGSYPEALALSENGKRLFVADSSANAVAVFDLKKTADSDHQTASGFIPTDWYPTALASMKDDLLIATSKGEGTGPNDGADQIPSSHRHRQHPYIPTLLFGSAIRLSVEEINRQLPDFTKRVEENNLVQSDPGEIQFQGGSNPIKHVIYIIKENRTYDQIFGDLKVGNGDPSLVMYGTDITPNQHKLALQFGVLDNFYDSGEVSGNGHNWSTAAITSDYNENTWQIAYRGKERTYDFSGMVADELPVENGTPDIDDPSTGYLWDNIIAHHVSFRDYGEFVTTVWCNDEAVASPTQGTPSPLKERCPKQGIAKGEPLPANVGQPHGSNSPWPWLVPGIAQTKATKAALRDHFDTNFPDFNTEYPDQLRADEFLNEFLGFVQAKQSGKGDILPSFILLYLPDDHTHGTSPGAPRPAASVADNDLAVGRVVEAVSHSPYWDDTAIFVLEDDAQNGFDHVDAHRSTALVISKYSTGSVDHPFVDHHFFTTVSMVHTMEKLLGVPPMNQNDAFAPLMAQEFSGSGNQSSFTADWSNRDNGLIYQTNSLRAQGSGQSGKMDFSRPDAANAAVLNAILWRDRKGAAPIPMVKRALAAADDYRESKTDR